MAEQRKVAGMPMSPNESNKSRKARNGPLTSLGKAALGLGKAALGLGKAALGLGKAALGLGKAALGLGKAALGRVTSAASSCHRRLMEVVGATVAEFRRVNRRALAVIVVGLIGLVVTYFGLVTKLIDSVDINIQGAHIDHINGADFNGIAHDISAAFLIAGLLAVIVDVGLKRDMVISIFRQVISHVLHDAIKEEVVFLAEESLVCNVHHQEIVLRPLAGTDDLLKVSVTLERTFENVGSRVEELHGTIKENDWQNSGNAKITRCEVTVDGHTFGGDTGKSDEVDVTSIDATVRRAELRAPVRLKPHKTCVVKHSWWEAYHRTDRWFFFPRYLTNQPHLTITWNACKDIDVEGFVFPGRRRLGRGPDLAQGASVAAGKERKLHFDGVVVPGQAIGVTWRQR
jgi:hypothetical protein